jgi:membrane protein DedA with SNARE-associated domain
VNLSHLLATYGYWAVFALVAAESLGIPLPGETALILAAAYAGRTHHLSGWVIFAVASAAAVTGDNIGFWIGHQGGYRLARKHGHRIRLDERKLKTARYLFDAHGPKVVFVGRFVSVLRTYAAFLAGASQMAWRKFLPANAFGGIAWAGACTLAAYLAGDALQQASAAIGWALIGTGAAATLAAVLLLRRHVGTLADRAEAAYPGPLEPAIPHRGDMRPPAGACHGHAFVPEEGL